MSKRRHPNEADPEADQVPAGEDGAGRPRFAPAKRARPTVADDPNEADRDAPDAPPPGYPGE